MLKFRKNCANEAALEANLWPKFQMLTVLTPFGPDIRDIWHGVADRRAALLVLVITSRKFY